jgi:hypothetical protein
MWCVSVPCNFSARHDMLVVILSLENPRRQMKRAKFNLGWQGYGGLHTQMDHEMIQMVQ